MKKIIVVTGQTATGKTKYALDLATKLDGELISADSRQIYQYLNVITGKDLPDNSEFKIHNSQFELSDKDKAAIGYYLIDEIKVWGYSALDPKIAGSSYYFKLIATEAIQDTISRGKIPIVVGGSYLYLKHLLYGFDTETIRPDWKLRADLEGKSPKELGEILRSINERMFKQLNISDSKNPHRLIRKIEIARSQAHSVRGGKTPGVKIAQTPGIEEKRRYKIAKFIGLRFKNKNELISNIDKRVEERMKNGAVLEVQNLLKMGYKRSDPGLKTIGYSQILDYLEGNFTLVETVKQWKTAEAQYAGRQYTFMKKDKNIEWKEV